MGYRSSYHGKGVALEGDPTSTGARCIASISHRIVHGRRVVYVGDKTTTCPKCGRMGVIATGEYRHISMGRIAAVDGSIVHCGCPSGTNWIVAPEGQWIGDEPNPAEVAMKKLLAERKAAAEEEARQQAAERERNRVFAKS